MNAPRKTDGISRLGFPILWTSEDLTPLMPLVVYKLIRYFSDQIFFNVQCYEDNDCAMSLDRLSIFELRNLNFVQKSHRISLNTST